jgi:hypothetical protein
VPAAGLRSRPYCATVTRSPRVLLRDPTYVELGRLSNLDEKSFDLGSLPAAKYVRVTDRSSPTAFPLLRDGFDLDAVDVLSGCA